MDLAFDNKNLHIKKNKFDINLILTNNGKELILRKYGFKDWDTLCAAVGRGGIKEGHVLNKLYDNYIMELEKTTTVEEKFQNKSVTNRTINNDSGVQVSGLNDASIRFSKCCSPIPGDEIVGFITRGRGVSIHRTDCANILNSNKVKTKDNNAAFVYLNVSFAAGLKPSIKFDPPLTMTSTPSPGGSETLPSSPSLTCAQVSISSTSHSV